MEDMGNYGYTLFRTIPAKLWISCLECVHSPLNRLGSKMVRKILKIKH